MDALWATASQPLLFPYEISPGVSGIARRSACYAINGLSHSPTGSCKAHERLVKHYGRSVRVQGAGPVSTFTFYISRHFTKLWQWDQRLLTFDPVALNHVARNPNIYEKPWQTQRYITSMIGCGLLSADGTIHKRQRRVATPAFSIQNLRAFAPIVFERAFRLRNRWRGIVRKDDEGGTVLDVCLWASRIAFDVIGAAGPCTVPLPSVIQC